MQLDFLKYTGGSWLGYLNFLILQWFFIRLAKVVDTKTQKTIRYTWLIGIVPLTGWWNKYKYVKSNFT